MNQSTVPATPHNPHSTLEELGRPIWTELFAVTLRYKDTVNQDYLSMHGYPSAGIEGDDVLDQQMRNEPVDTMMSINDMSEYFDKGIVVTLRNYKDTLEIFTIINRYLLAWKTNIETGVNIGLAPYRDLILLDKMAERMFHYASEYFTSDHMASALVEHLSIGSNHTLTRASGREHFEKMKNQSRQYVNNAVQNAPNHPTYQSLAGFFSSRIVHRG